MVASRVFCNSEKSACIFIKDFFEFLLWDFFDLGDFFEGLAEKRRLVSFSAI